MSIRVRENEYPTPIEVVGWDIAFMVDRDRGGVVVEVVDGETDWSGRTPSTRRVYIANEDWNAIIAHVAEQAPPRTGRLR